jgi:hypothetical protein
MTGGVGDGRGAAGNHDGVVGGNSQDDIP